MPITVPIKPAPPDNTPAPDRHLLTAGPGDWENPAPAPAPAPGKIPDALNPMADSHYADTIQGRQELSDKQDFVFRAESAKPDEKAKMLATIGGPANYARMKMIASWNLNQDDRSALEGERQQVEGKAPEIEGSWSSDPVFQGIIAAATAGGSEGMELTAQGVIKAAQNLTMFYGTKVLTQQAQKAAEMLAPNHPNVAALGGTLASLATIIAMGNPPGEAAVPGARADVAKRWLLGMKPGEAAQDEGAAAEPAAEGEGAATAAAEPAGGAPGGPANQPPVEPPAEGAAAKTAEATPGAQEQGSAVAQAWARGDQSDAAYLAAARANPMTHEEVAGIKLGPATEEGKMLPEEPLSPLNMVRAQVYAGQACDNWVKAMQRFNLTGSAEDAEALRAARDEVESVRSPIEAVWNQAGLALQKIKPTDPTSAQIRALFQMMDENMTSPERLSAALSNMPTIAEREKLIESAAGVKDWTAPGALYKLYVNSILSLNSVAKKAASDAANIAMQIPVRGLGEDLSRAAELYRGAPYGTMGVLPGETHAVAQAMIENFGDSLKIGLDSAEKGEAMFEGNVGFFDNPAQSRMSLMGGSGYENTPWGKMLDYYGHLVSIPGRSIIGVDQFSKSMQYNIELYALANRQAQIEAGAEGLEGAELSGRISELMKGYIQKTPGWMQDQAMNVAKVNTFQEDLQGSLAAFDKLRQSSYITRTLMPFFKTPVNITLQGIRMSPMAPASGVWRGAIAGGGPEAAIAASKTLFGSAIIAYFVNHALKGNLTGGVPANLNADLKDDWLSDHQPYSIKGGDGRFVSYEGLEPISWVLGTAVDAAPMFAYLNNEDAGHAAEVLARAFMNEANRQPMWGALHQLISAIDDAERGKTVGAFEVPEKMAAGLIPSMAANYAGYEDPVKRQAAIEDDRGRVSTLLNSFRNRIPWLKQNGLATLDDFGRPVITPPGFLYNELPAYVSTVKKPDAVTDEMVRLSQSVSFKPPEIKAVGPSDPDTNDEDPYGAPLSSAEQNRAKVIRANVTDPANGVNLKLYDAIAKMIKSKDYEGWTDTVRANQWQALFTGYGAYAKQQLIAENPAVRARMMAAYAGRVRQMTPGAAQNGAAAIGAP